MQSTDYHEGQNLNDWVKLLDGLYGATQNYSKSPYEIYTHLNEVCGVFGKLLFKTHDIDAAINFLPKMFAWAIALLKAVNHEANDLEGIILRKFPLVCPYCGNSPCSCAKGEKPSFDQERLRKDFFLNSRSMEHRSANDFQLMFQRIYGQSRSNFDATDLKYEEDLRQMFTRMVEELSEIAESIRFYHLYPVNFENEIADFFAWWFAFIPCFPDKVGKNRLLADEILWNAYPGYCPYCNLSPCFCRPRPVREMMSKPAPGQEHKFDVLTALYNQGAYNEDILHISEGLLPASLPATCVRIDADDFKKVNDTFGHSAGDTALRHIATILRSKARERDRVYRISGDEFGVLLTDATEEEAVGMMKRVIKELHEKEVHWVNSSGKPSNFSVSVSIGVAQCDDNKLIEETFNKADDASYYSKKEGKGRVTAYSQILNK